LRLRLSLQKAFQAEFRSKKENAMKKHQLLLWTFVLYTHLFIPAAVLTLHTVLCFPHLALAEHRGAPSTVTVVIGTTGKIAGTVVDAANDEPLIGATVTVEGTKLGAKTNIDGNYVILNVPPGTYTLRCTYVGYQTATLRNVKVSVDMTTRADFRLQVESVQAQEIVVSAERNLVIKDMTATRAAVGSDEIKTLPIQNPSQVLEIQAGVVGGTFRGGRRGEAMYIVDGFSVNDVYDGNQGRGINNLGVESQAIQELELLTGGYNAEYGQAMSAIINIVTKEGGPEYEGTLQTFLGGYLTPRLDLFPNVNNIRTIGSRDIQGSLGGPLNFFGGPKDLVTFFVNARYFEDEGRFYGQRVFNPGDILPPSIFTGNQIGGFIGIARTQQEIDRLIANYRQQNPGNYDFFLYPIDPTDPPKNEREREEKGIRVYRVLRQATDNFRQFATGSGEFVPMNPYRKFSGLAKLTFRPEIAKISAQFQFSDEQFRNFDFDWQYIPDGVATNYRRSYTGILNITQAISNTAFFNIGASLLYSSERNFLYDDPVDKRYLDWGINNLTPAGAYRPGQADFGQEFLVCGAQTGHFSRSTTTINIKGDISAQVNMENLVKAGIDVKFHRLWLESASLFLDESSLQTGVQRLRRAELGEAGYDFYDRRPIEFAAFIQDKFEINRFIVNFGVRLDVFYPDGLVPKDPSDPSPYDPLRPENLPRDANGNVVPNTRENLPIYVRNGQNLLERNYERASLKWQLSPRLGVAFAIAETSVLRFFFGQVFQIPNFEFLYRNPFFRRNPGADVSGPFGNADLKPQRTIKGELGLQQQFGEDIAVDIALYFNDIRDLNGSAFLREYFDRGAYTQFVNTDYALTRGLTIRIDKRFSQLFNFGIDYTFQVAQGNTSDPAAAAFALAANAPLPTSLVLLDWDQTHTLNLTGSFDIDGWLLSTIARYGSGFPYTPDLNAPLPILVRGSRGEIVTNSLRRPATFTVDIRAQKTFSFDKNKLSVYVQIYNLLDFGNQSGNYPFALLTPDMILQNTRVRSSVNTPEQYQTRPQLFAPPRQVLVGASFSL
jgi:hypothetical protein